MCETHHVEDVLIDDVFATLQPRCIFSHIGVHAPSLNWVLPVWGEGVDPPEH